MLGWPRALYDAGEDVGEGGEEMKRTGLAVVSELECSDRAVAVDGAFEVAI